MKFNELSQKGQEVIAEWFSNPSGDTSNMYHFEDRVAKHSGLLDPVFIEVKQFIDARNIGNEKYFGRDQWMETVRNLDELAHTFAEHSDAIDRDQMHLTQFVSSENPQKEVHMIVTLEQIADLVDSVKLRQIDQRLDDELTEKFLDATEHLPTLLCDEADEICERVERAGIIEYLRERFANPVEPVVPIS